jgi:hypothetical protein
MGLFRDGECTLQERFGIVVPPKSAIKTGKIVEPVADIRMVRPERCLADRERPLKELLCFFIAAFGIVESGEVIESGGDGGIFISESPLALFE